MKIFKYIQNTIKRQFLAGLLVIVPLIITYLVLRFLLTTVDGILAPYLQKALGYAIPGLGIIVSVLLILLAGALTRGVIGRRMIYYWEKLLISLPLVRTIYSAAKQLLISIAGPQSDKFQRVVIVPYPRIGVYALAFVAQDVDISVSGEQDQFMSVFIPSTPTPFTGFVVIVNKRDIYPTDINIEEAIKFLVSGGIAVPESMLPNELKKSQVS